MKIFLLATALLLALPPADVLANSTDAITNYCHLWNHQSAYKDGKIYVDGGDMVYVDSNYMGNFTGARYYGVMRQLLELDVSRSWNWMTYGFTNDVYLRYPKGVNKEGNHIPIHRRGALFPAPDGDERVFLYGGTSSFLNTSSEGFNSPELDTHALWSFSTTDKTWTEYGDEDVFGGVPTKLPNAGASAAVPKLNLAFYYQGQIDSGSKSEDQWLNHSSYPIANMIVLNTKTRTARNVTTESTPEDRARVRGKMEYIESIGRHGAIVRVGGTPQTMQNENDTILESPVSMDLIYVLDVGQFVGKNQPSSVRWVQQHATGDIPEPRTDFCLVSAAAADKSSHQLYLYGGRNNNTIYDDIYVLSLPSFRWTLIFQGFSPRAFHTCHRVAGSQMITIGGLRSFENMFELCDWEYVGLGIYDMNQGVWGQTYNARYEPYQVPSNISSIIGGGTDGQATVKEPEGGFSDAAMNEIFHSPPPKLSSGAIAGIVVGGVIVCLAALAFWLRDYIVSVWDDGRLWPRALAGNASERASTYDRTSTAEHGPVSDRVSSWVCNETPHDATQWDQGSDGDSTSDHPTIKTQPIADQKRE